MFNTWGWAADKTYRPDADGFIYNWLMLEPIELGADVNAHTEEMEKEFFEKELFKGQFTATPKAGQRVTVKGTEFAWNAVEADDAILYFDKVDNSIYLGIAYVMCEKEIAGARLSIGSDDSSAWWVNGKEVLRVHTHRSVERDQDQSDPVTLKAGINVLSFAVINGDGRTGVSARFLDKRDDPITKIKISLTPPVTDPK